MVGAGEEEAVVGEVADEGDGFFGGHGSADGEGDGGEAHAVPDEGGGGFDVGAVVFGRGGGVVGLDERPRGVVDIFPGGYGDFVVLSVELAEGGGGGFGVDGEQEEGERAFAVFDEDEKIDGLGFAVGREGKRSIVERFDDAQAAFGGGVDGKRVAGFLAGDHVPGILEQADGGGAGGGWGAAQEVGGGACFFGGFGVVFADGLAHGGFGDLGGGGAVVAEHAEAVGSVFEQDAAGFGVGVARGEHQWCAAFGVDCFDRGPGAKKQFGGGDIAGEGGEQQGGIEFGGGGFGGE